MVNAETAPQPNVLSVIRACTELGPGNDVYRAGCEISDCQHVHGSRAIRRSDQLGRRSFSVATVSGSAGSFTVSGRHKYAKNGHYKIIVTITMSGPTSAGANGSGIVVVSNPGKHHLVARLIHRLTRKHPKAAKRPRR